MSPCTRQRIILVNFEQAAIEIVLRAANSRPIRHNHIVSTYRLVQANGYASKSIPVYFKIVIQPRP